MLVLLDWSVALDTVDHAVLLACLAHCASINRSALKCFKSYLSNRSFNVNIGEHSSEEACQSCGVPKG